MNKNATLLRDSVGLATRFVRDQWRFVVAAAGIGALAMTALALASELAPVLALPTTIAAGLVQACLYAAFMGAALIGAQRARLRWFFDGALVWGAMAIIGFFMFIVLFVISLPISMILFAGPLAPYADELTRAGNNQQVVLELMQRFAMANPTVVTLVAFVVFTVWMLLTSRLYLAGPASVEAQRVRTFETWAWTRGATLRILAARLTLLAPAYVLSVAVGYVVGRAVGLDLLNPVATAAAMTTSSAGFILYMIVSTFVTYALYSALEAALSAYLYRALKPPAA